MNIIAELTAKTEQSMSFRNHLNDILPYSTKACSNIAATLKYYIILFAAMLLQLLLYGPFKWNYLLSV